MHLRKVSLTNFCQHRSMAVEFHPGVTGVLGGNGRGKSNLLKAVRFALIKASGNTGAMAEDLNWAAALAGESGFVELDFEKAGIEGRVKRYVDKGKASLRFGETKAGSSKAVDEAMADITAVPKRVVEEIVFVDQGAIERILFERPAERGKQFQALFGTGNAEAIRVLLQKELAGISDSPVDEQILKLQQQLDTVIDVQLRDLTVTREQLAKAVDGFDEAAHRKVIEAFAVAQQLKQQIAEAHRQITGLAADADANDRVLAGLQAQVTELAAGANSERDEIAKARERVGALTQLKRASAMRVQLLTDKKAQNAVLTTALPVSPSVTQEQVDTSRHEVGQSKAVLAPKRAFVQAFKGGDDEATCPTCMQPVHGASGLAQQFETEIENQDDRIAGTEAMLNKAEQAARVYRGAVQEDQVRRSLASSRLMEVEHQLSTLGAADYDPTEAESLQTRLHAFDVKEKQLTEAKRNLQTKQVAVESARIALSDQRVQLATLEAKVTEAPTAAQQVEAQQAIQGFNDAKAQTAGIDGQLAQLRGQRAGVLTELEQLKAESSKLEAVHKYKMLCEQARSVLHRDCLPLIVTRSFLAVLNTHMAEYLQIFDVPFTAAIEGDLSVVCQFPGVGKQSAGRLSGGQRVVLGIAFRFAICRLFAADLHFMILDEPTAFLDSDKIQGVITVLQSVRRHMHNTGAQLIVVTHEPELAVAFDHTVRL